MYGVSINKWIKCRRTVPVSQCKRLFVDESARRKRRARCLELLPSTFAGARLAATPRRATPQRNSKCADKQTEQQRQKRRNCEYERDSRAVRRKNEFQILAKCLHLFMLLEAVARRTRNADDTNVSKPRARHSRFFVSSLLDSVRRRLVGPSRSVTITI